MTIGVRNLDLVLTIYGAFPLHSSSTTFSITKRYLLNVGGVVIARLCETAVTSFYTPHKHINNGGHGGSGVLAALPVFSVTHKAREESRIAISCCRYLKMPGLILVWDGS